MFPPPGRHRRARGRINVYVVNLVDGSTARGNACATGGGFVAIAAGSGAELLAHELDTTSPRSHEIWRRPSTSAT